MANETITITKNHIWLAAAAILIAALLWFYVIPELQAVPPIASPTPTSQIRTAQNGSLIDIDYTLRLENGTIYSTTVEAEARAAGVYSPTSDYTPLRVRLGNQTLIPGFEAAVIGMQENETKQFTLSPAQAYGEYDTDLLYPMPRNYEAPRIENVSISDILFIYPNFTENTTTMRLTNWNATVLAISNNTVTIRHDPELSVVINADDTYFWPEAVVAITNDTITMRRLPTLGKYYPFETLQGTDYGFVSNVTNETITFDFNHPLAGKTLSFTVTLVRVVNQTG